MATCKLSHCLPSLTHWFWAPFPTLAFGGSLQRGRPALPPQSVGSTYTSRSLMALGSSFFFTRAFARSFSLLQGNTETPGEGQQGRAASARGAWAGIPSLPPGTQRQPTPHGAGPRRNRTHMRWSRRLIMRFMTAYFRAFFCFPCNETDREAATVSPEEDPTRVPAPRALLTMLLLPAAAAATTAAATPLLPVPSRRITTLRPARMVRELRHFRPPAPGSGSLRR